MPAQEFEVVPETSAMVPANPTELLRLGVTKGATIEELAKLMEMQFRWEANEAKKAFVVAMNAFKADPPQIIKTRAVTYEKGPNAKPAFFYAPLEEVCPLIIKALNEHGITHRWRPDPPFAPGNIRITCVLTHKLGHSEESGLEAPPDPSGGKNGIQAVISTSSYLERISLLAVTGLSAEGMDNDGGGKAQMDDLKERLEFIANCRTVEELFRISNQHFKAAKLANDVAAQKAIVAAKDKRKGEIQRGEL